MTTYGSLVKSTKRALKVPGVYVVQGKLFFVLLDKSTVSCTCIGEPYASEIVKLFDEGNK